MYYIFQEKIDDHTTAIESSADREHAIGRMEYLALHNMDEKTTGFYVESGDGQIIAEWEI